MKLLFIAKVFVFFYNYTTFALAKMEKYQLNIGKTYD